MELFYTIADVDCATARKAIIERGLKDRVSFRNLYYPEVQHDFKSRGGRTPPAIWDGARLHEGLNAVLEVIATTTARP